jgi:hypothetical protein
MTKSLSLIRVVPSYFNTTFDFIKPFWNVIICGEIHGRLQVEEIYLDQNSMPSSSLPRLILLSSFNKAATNPLK